MVLAPKVLLLKGAPTILVQEGTDLDPRIVLYSSRSGGAMLIIVASSLFLSTCLVGLLDYRYLDLYALSS